MKVILDTLNFNLAVQKIVDTILTEGGYLNLGYRIVVLALIDPQTKVLKRISISKTQDAEKALENTPVPFGNIDIPLNYSQNICIKVLNEQKPAVTSNWSDILVPAISIADSAKLQEVVGIKSSIIYPVRYQGSSQGVLIFSLVKSENEVTDEERDLIGGYADLVGLAVQNSKLYSQVEESASQLQLANIKLKELDIRKNEFLNMAAHELRAPMTAIKGYISMLIEGDAGEIPEKARGFLTDAQGVAERLA
jgi:signal transduction histidine kinase